MSKQSAEMIGAVFTPKELANFELMKEKLSHLGLDEKALAVLLREARHWRSGSKLKLAQMVRNHMRNNS